MNRNPSRYRSLLSRYAKSRGLWAFFVIFVVIPALLFLKIGRWLVIQDPLQRAQAIVVLSGGLPMRALEAARIYRLGYAPEVWLTRSAEPDDSMKALGIPYEGEAEHSREVLEHEGVPSSAILILPTPIANTADEMRAINLQLGSRGGDTVIIVTTKAHTRRVRALWNKLVPRQNQAIIRAAVADPFDAEHWWRTTRDALDVVREILGLLNVWAGLPLHPGR